MAPIVAAPLALSDVVCAGLDTLLQPFHPRVRLLVDVTTEPFDVGLVEPELLDEDWLPPSDLPVVALAWSGQVRGGDPAWGWKVADIVGIDATADELVRRIEGAYRRRLNGTTPRWRSLDGLLTYREAEVLTRICRGSSNQQIAAELYLSVNSIKVHIRTAYRKMGVTSRTQAVLWGLEHGYGTAPPPGSGAAQIRERSAAPAS